MIVVYREEFTFDTKEVAILAAAVVPGVHAGSAIMNNCKLAVKQSWNWDVEGETLRIMQDIAFAVFDRSAALAAMSIAALAERTRVGSCKHNLHRNTLFSFAPNVLRSSQAPSA